MKKEQHNHYQFLLESIIDFSDDAITSQTPEGIITTWNKSAEKIFGYSAGEITGKHVSILIPPDRINEEQEIIGKIKAGGHVAHYETQRVKKNGTVTDISLIVSPIKNENGIIIGATKIYREITDRKKAQELQNKIQQRYQQVVENILDGLMIDDPDGKVLYANGQFLKLFGLEEADLANLVLEDYIAPEFRPVLRDRHNRRVAGEEVPTTFEYQGLRKDGTRIWLEVRVCKVYENGKVIGTQSAIRNISDRKKIEDDINKLNQSLEHIVSERTARLEAVNKELESFSYSVAHDLRAPLRIINGYSEILRNDYKDKLNAEGERIINTIVNNTQRMGKLIDELLNLSRLGRKELTMHNTDMNAMLKTVISEQMTIGDKPIKFDIGELYPAVCDSTLIRQVWGNLISNAIKYSGKKDNQSIEVNSTKKDNTIIYSVKDNGAGFDMRYSDKLFGVFQRLHKQTEFEGTGVGLALVQRIITKHGGKVWAEAEVDKGATFYFSLPIIDHIN